MAIIGNNALTLADWAKRVDPDGKTAVIVEALSQTNQILEDARFVEGNLPTGHRTTVRTGLPSTTWRRLNYGVATAKSTTAQITDNCGLLETRSEVDEELAKLNGNLADFRLSEARAFIEAMGQEVADTMIYGNESDEPAEFTGLAPRYNSLAAESGQNIIDAAGNDTDLTSIWLVCWGDQTTHGIFPKGSKAGLVHNDLGLGDAFDADGNRFRAYMDQYKFNVGLSVRDWRYNTRIANIDISQVQAGNVDLIELMIRALHRLPSMGMGQCAFYMNRTIRQELDIQAKDATNVQLNIGEYAGQWRTMFRDVPLRTVDRIVNTETRVV
jgi:hypothetical protein